MVNLPAMREIWVRSLGREDSLEIPVFLPGESHGQRSLVGYHPWGHIEWNTTEWLNNKSVPTDRHLDQDFAITNIAAKKVWTGLSFHTCEVELHSEFLAEEYRVRDSGQ